MLRRHKDVRSSGKSTRRKTFFAVAAPITPAKSKRPWPPRWPRSAPARETETNAGQRGRTVGGNIGHPFQVEVAYRRGGNDPAPDFRASGLQTFRIKPREMIVVLGLDGFDHAAVQILVDDEMAEPAR